MTDRGAIRRRVSFSDAPSFIEQIPFVPKEQGVDQLDLPSVIGDGKSRVTVSLEYSDKDFGSGFSAHVSISASCNQDEGAIGFTHDILTTLAGELLNQTIDEGVRLYAARKPK